MKEDILIKFANKIIKIRKERHLTQEEFAFLCGIDRTYVGRIERLKRNPTLLIIDKIAKGLNIDISELLKFD